MGLRLAASRPAFIFFRHSRETKGSKWQLIPTTWAPAFAILMPHSAADTPCMSPSGPLHILDVLVVLAEQEVHALRHKDIDLFLELFLDVGLGHARQVGRAL